MDGKWFRYDCSILKQSVLDEEDQKPLGRTRNDEDAKDWSQLLAQVKGFTHPEYTQSNTKNDTKLSMKTKKVCKGSIKKCKTFFKVGLPGCLACMYAEKSRKANRKCSKRMTKRRKKKLRKETSQWGGKSRSNYERRKKKRRKFNERLTKAIKQMKTRHLSNTTIILLINEIVSLCLCLNAETWQPLYTVYEISIRLRT